MTKLPDAEKLCQDLVRELKPRIGPKSAMVGLFTGGAWLAERLHPMLGLKTPLGLMDIAFYRDDYTARGLKHDSVGAEHLLLALLRAEESLAARIFASLDITADEVRARVVVRLVGEGDTLPKGELPLAPRAAKIVRRAQGEALAHGHRSVGTEHLLLALGHELRVEIIRMISGPHGRSYRDT